MSSVGLTNFNIYELSPVTLGLDRGHEAKLFGHGLKMQDFGPKLKACRTLGQTSQSQLLQFY